MYLLVVFEPGNCFIPLHDRIANIFRVCKLIC